MIPQGARSCAQRLEGANDRRTKLGKKANEVIHVTELYTGVSGCCSRACEQRQQL